MQIAHKFCLIRMNIKCPGAILMVWTLVSCALGIYLYVKLCSEVQGSLAPFLIFGIAAVIWCPVAKFLHPSLQKENETLLFTKIELLVKKGKRRKAEALFKMHEQSFLDRERTLRIKGQLMEDKDDPV